jgi:hypothetical protein
MIRQGAGQQPVQPTLQIGVILRQRAVLQRVAPFANRHSLQQQKMKAECEPDVAFLDRILRIAQQMGQAHAAAAHPFRVKPRRA